MLIANMTFLEWAGAAVIAGLSGGVGLKLIGWLKEHLDRKARKLSYHAKALVEQADQICGLARAIVTVARDNAGSDRFRVQASALWTTSSTSSLLNVWLANAWVLDEERRLRPSCGRFEAAVERLRQAAVAWHDADLKWRAARGITEDERIIGGGPDDSPEASEKTRAVPVVVEAFEAFLAEFQVLHNALQPKVREYVSRSEREASEDEQ